MPGKHESGDGIAGEPKKQGNIEAEDAVDKLPPGWIKEIKYRKTGGKRDINYVDPESGYIFFTLKDVSRYLETGDVNSCLSKPRKRIGVPSIREDHLLSAERKVKSRGAATKQRTLSGEKPKSKNKMEGKKVTPVNETSPVRPMGNLNQEVIDNNSREKHQEMDVEITNVDQMRQEDIPAKTEKTEYLQPKKRGKHSRSSRLREKKSAAGVSLSAVKPQNSENQEDTPTKSDNTEHLNPKKRGRRSSRLRKMKSANADELKKTNAADADAAKQTGDINKGDGAYGNAAEQTLVSANDNSNQLQAKAESARSLDPASCSLSLLNLHSGSEKLDLSRAEYALSSLCGDSARDPCIEFAVKLLMDELPLPKEAAGIERSFRQQMKSQKRAKLKASVGRSQEHCPL